MEQMNQIKILCEFWLKKMLKKTNFNLLFYAS